MGLFGSVFGTREPRKSFGAKQQDNVLWDTQIKKLVRRTYMKTVTKQEKEVIISALLREKAGGVTETECRRVLYSLYKQKTISRSDYDKLMRVFASAYKK
ncbi:hypothetical protein KKH43_00550 [Patescibacteria group bacterium]|nr:hypothetical protein [Patescibacteria group bacterium]